MRLTTLFVFISAMLCAQCECSESVADTINFLEPVATFHSNGQSNDIGFGLASDLTNAERQPIQGYNIFSWWLPSWNTYTADAQGNGNATQNGSLPNGTQAYGLEYTFGQEFLLEYGEAWLVKAPVGGTSLETDWCATCPSWLQYVNTYLQAKNDLQAQGFYPDNKVFIWYQGESDAILAPPNAQNYEANLYSLMARVKTLLGGNIRILIVRIGDINTNFQLVQDAQVAYANSDPNASYCDAAIYYPVPSSPPFNNIHLEGQDLQDLGDCLWAGYLTIQ